MNQEKILVIAKECSGKFHFLVYYGSPTKYSVRGMNSLVGGILKISEHDQEGTMTRDGDIRY